MKKYDQKILKTAIPAFVISAICYAAMWGIMTRTENTFFAGYIGGGGSQPDKEYSYMYSCRGDIFCFTT